MAITRDNRGFALLIAVIFMSVMLAFGLALGSISYKQQVLASSAVQSQYAFYAADAALECALYYDQRENRFAYPATEPPSAPSMTCDGTASSYTPPSLTGIVSYTANQWVIAERLSLDSDKRCADVTIYKTNPSGTPPLPQNYIFSQGYDVPCSVVASPGGARFVARGISIHY